MSHKESQAPRELSDYSKLVMEIWGTIGDDFTSNELLEKYKRRYGANPNLGILGGVSVILRELTQTGLLSTEDGVYHIKQS